MPGFEHVHVNGRSLALFGLLLALLTACGSEAPAGGTVTPCSTDADCAVAGSGYVCEEGVCRQPVVPGPPADPTCAADADCAGACGDSPCACIAARCVAVFPERCDGDDACAAACPSAALAGCACAPGSERCRVRCLSDTDCPADGPVCLAGWCLRAGEGPPCAEVADCAAVCPVSSVCACDEETWQCTAHPRTCEEDRDCLVFCVDGGTCVCRDGLCSTLPDVCAADGDCVADCPAGRECRCLEGRCETAAPAEDCVTAEDCAGEGCTEAEPCLCHRGACYSGPRIPLNACEADVECVVTCPDGAECICEDGTCLAFGDVTLECAADADCAADCPADHVCHCLFGSCEAVPVCQDDAACAAGCPGDYLCRCVDGECQIDYGAQCISDEHCGAVCPPHWTCVCREGRCLPTGGSDTCEADADCTLFCPAAMRCECREERCEVVGCATDAGCGHACPAGGVCVCQEGACVETGRCAADVYCRTTCAAGDRCACVAAACAVVGCRTDAGCTGHCETERVSPNEAPSRARWRARPARRATEAYPGYAARSATPPDGMRRRAQQERNSEIPSEPCLCIEGQCEAVDYECVRDLTCAAECPADALCRCVDHACAAEVVACLSDEECGWLCPAGVTCRCEGERCRQECGEGCG